MSRSLKKGPYINVSLEKKEHPSPLQSTVSYWLLFSVQPLIFFLLPLFYFLNFMN